MSFVDEDMNRELEARRNPVTRDTGGLAPPGEVLAQRYPDANAEWSLGGLVGASFRQNNTIGSLAYLPEMGTFDPNWKPPLEELSPDLMVHAPYLATSRNQHEFFSMVQSIEKQRADRREIAAAPGWLSFATGIGTTLIDPTVLAPQAGAIKKIEGGYSIARSAMALGISGGAAVAGQEAILHGMQQERTLEESAVNVGAGIVLGGLLGGAGAALLNRAGASAVRRAAEGFDGIISNAPDETAAVDVLNGAPPAHELKYPYNEYSITSYHGSRTVADRLRSEQTGLQQGVFHTEDPTLANRFAEGRATGETPFVNLYDDADFASKVGEHLRGKELEDFNAKYKRWQELVETNNRLHDQIPEGGSYETHPEIATELDGVSKELRVLQRELNDTALKVGSMLDGAPNVSKLRVRPGNMLEHEFNNGKFSFDEEADVIQRARDEGYDTVKFKGVDEKGNPITFYSSLNDDNIIPYWTPEPKEQLAAISSGGAKPAGAEAARTATLADLSISGRIAGKLGKWTSFMNPALRATQRMTREARQVMLDMQGGTVYHQINDAFEAATPGGAAATLARGKNLSRLTAGTIEHDRIYGEMKKAGINLSQREFEEKVGLAMGRNDEDANPFVARAAKAWREKVFNPFLKEAQELELIPRDLDVKGAESYFSRVYDAPLIIAHEGEFKSRLIPLMEQRLKAAYDAAVEKLEFKQGVLDFELSVLRATPEQREQMVGEIDQLLADLGLRGSAQRQKDIMALQAAARELEKNGDVAGGAAARAEARDLMIEGDRDFYNWKQAKRQVAKLNTLLKFSVPGQEAEAARVLDQMVALEDAQAVALESFATRAAANRRKLARVKPEEEQAFVDENLEMFRKATGQAWDTLLRMQGERQRIDEKIAAANEKIKQKVAAADTNIAGIKAQQDEAKKLIAQLEPARKRLDQLMAKQVKLHERLSVLDQRIADAGDDFDSARVALEEGYVALIDTTTDRTLMRGEKMKRLKEKLKALGPEVTEREIAKRVAKRDALTRAHEEKWMPNYEKEPPLGRFAKEIVDDFTNKVTGRNSGDGTTDLPEYATPVTRGPLKDRTSYFPDEVFHQPPAGANRGFLDTNVKRVAHRYARIMAAENELTRKFGRADMKEQIEAIGTAYAKARELVQSAPDAATAWRWLGMEGKAPKTIEEINTELARDEKGALNDIMAVRDIIRGTYKVKENQGNFGRLVRGLTAFNYIRSMGGVVISNLTELYRPAMVHGLGPYMGLGVKALTGQLEGIKLSVREAKLAGLVAERVLHHRLNDWAEFADPLAHGTAVERMMENAARVANKWSGLSLFTDFEEGFASVMTQDRLINALSKGEAAKEKDLKWMAFLNLGSNERRRLGELLAQHGEKVDGVWVANTERWTAGLEAKLRTLDPDDPAYSRTAAELESTERAVDAYRQAVLKDVNSVIVQRTPGDIALAASTPLGRLLLQFRTYNLAAHQKVMLRGFQENPGAFLSGIVGMTSIGMLVSYLQAVRGGQERLKKWQTSAANPGFLIGEGLDKSGLFPMLFDVSNTADAAIRASGYNFNPLKTPALMAFPQKAQTGDSSRWNPNNNMFGELLGPSAGLVEDLPVAAGAAIAKARGQEIGAKGRGAVNRVIPFGSYLGMKEFLQVMSGDSPYMRK